MSRDVLGHRDVAVDRCWTLLPLSALSAMLSAMVTKNSALFYVAFMDEFGVSHQAASWPITVHGVVTHLTGLLVSLLQKKMSTYQIAVSGSLLNFIALVASAFAPTAAWMTFTLGVVGGVGYGMVVLSLSIYAMIYFDKYQGTASGCKYTGMTLAPLAFPLALSALIRMYSLSGTVLVLSAITLHTLPIAMLMNNPRPVTSCFGKKKRREALADTFCRDYGSKGNDAFLLGLAGIAMVPFAFGGSLLIGLFRDAMGSYDNLYRTMSAFCIVFAFMLFTFAFFERRAEKRLDYASIRNGSRWFDDMAKVPSEK
ncbi:hypothetical protein HPB50_018199 [Hyalomma asiaticum]|uniref:Uncharacterized protein n=1 Tax=Hyalomma asiaticum TaxID=266040 RepID=A0ACB7TM38_HYAAI|nr:hypothetical protein HPB50_018199 [Hyalomma asiaticum]